MSSGSLGNSTESFKVEAEKRDATTLVPFIQECIRPGTVIYSDEWRAYSQLHTLGYKHRTVNRSRDLVDPITGVHTQGVKSMWSQTKHMMRKERVMATSNKLLDTYLQEFLWRKKFDTDGEDTFIILQNNSPNLILSVDVYLCCHAVSMFIYI